MKLIYGRSGTGKSKYIYDKIKNSDYEKSYIITPEQFSFSSEKRLVETFSLGATTKVEVLSFERMAHRVITNFIKEKKDVIGKSGKSMIIYDSINRNKDKLNFLGKSLENVKTIVTQITELKKHGITVDNLKNQLDKTNDKYLKAKLSDIYILYNDFEKYMYNFLDENDVLTILYENVEKSHIFDGATFYIDEFAGFTKQEFLVIEKLNKIAKEVYITVCTDDTIVNKPPENDIFYDNKQTINTLKSICDIDDNNQIRLDKNYRFKNDELIHLEKNIFDFPYKVFEKDVNNIELFLADNSYIEIENVANNIYKLVREKGYRYKDIAVISKNLDNYSSLCKAIFNEYEIPYFIDIKKDLMQNIFIKYILSILDIFDEKNKWSYESVFNYLKTGIIKIENIFELENYCLKWGIKGKKWYKEKWNYEKKDDSNNFNNEQEIIIKPLLDLFEELKKEKTAKAISENLYTFLINNIDFSIFENNETNKKISIDDVILKDEELAKSWNIIIDLLLEIGKIFGDRKIKFSDYSKLLKVGLSTKELGKIPETQDKVIIGDVDRSRTHNIKALFIIGVNDGIFPAIQKDEGFLNDKDRDSLKEEGFMIAKGTIEKSYEENFNIYKAFSTAEEKLFVSYSASDIEGSPLRKSLIISKIIRIFPKLIEKNDMDENIVNKNVTFSRLLNNINNKDWEDVFNWYNKNEKEKLNSALQGLKYSNVPEKLSNENVEKAYGKILKSSISRLESYKNCPYSYFLKYGLQISNKEKFTIKSMDTGSFMHNVIDGVFKKLPDIKNESLERINETVDEVINEELENFNKFSLSEKYKVLVQRLKRVLKITIKYIVDSLKNSKFDLVGTEISFGNKDDKLPPITIDLENGKKVEINGKIDRLDIAKLDDGNYIRIIDYKSSAKELELNKVYYGLQLQLLTYSNEVCNNIVDAMTSGVLYFPLIDQKINNANRQLEDEEKEKLFQEIYRMNGYVISDINVIRAMDTSLDTGKSKVIPVEITSKGTIHSSHSKVLTKDEFQKLQNYTNQLIKEISNEILSGNIELRPMYSENGKYTSCSYCDYKSICNFDPTIKYNNYRYIPNMKKEKIFEKIEEKKIL